MVRVVFSYGPSCLNIRADLSHLRADLSSLTGRLVSVRVVRGPSCLVPIYIYTTSEKPVNDQSYGVLDRYGITILYK